ncbi:MAG: cell division protein ZipA C-terminal FtsZ-binding domain-containing protein [Gammaproteobacteria bacterium]
MAELRWLLLGLGLVIVAGIYLFTRFKPRLDRGLDALSSRREPTLGASKQGESKHGESKLGETKLGEPTLGESTPGNAQPRTANADVFHEPADPAEAEPEPEPPVLTERPARAQAKIVAIRLMCRSNSGFPAEDLILRMRDLGLRHGEFGIFHGGADDAGSDYSVASLVEPGSFDLTRIKKESYPGVSIFMRLPGNRDGVEIFDDMLATSRSLAKHMDGELLDEQGSSLSIQRERYLREEVIQFEHQGLS